MENKLFEMDLELLVRAERAYAALAAFRRDRERNKRFTYGDQWGDSIYVDGTMMREEDYIRSQGNVPLKNNLIRRLVRNVLGVFRNRWELPKAVAEDIRGRVEEEALQKLLERNARINRLEELYARTMEEFLISGLAVHRKWYGRKGRLTDCWTDFVSPDNFFSDTEARDFRGDDLSLVGEIHEMNFDALLAAFGESEEIALALRKIYPADCRCRVLEIWTREYREYFVCHDRLTGRLYKIEASKKRDVEKENSSRRMKYGDSNEKLIGMTWVISEEWRYSYLSPAGHVLRRGLSPYSHGGHPFVIKAYPFIDGEIHSFVSDIIDQQKFTNRLISMYDWILRASAKGVLLFPEGALPEGADMRDIADEWSRFNGVIVFRPKPGVPLPQQVSSNATNIGITELLDIQLRMMEDISGVNGALQGKLENGSMSGTLYNQQTQNSLTALADLLKSFDSFILDAAAIDSSNIMQFYPEQKIMEALRRDT